MMLLLEIFAKILFLPIYILLFFIALLFYLFSLSINAQVSFDECLEALLIRYYWDFDSF